MRSCIPGNAKIAANNVPIWVRIRFFCVDSVLIFGLFVTIWRQWSYRQTVGGTIGALHIFSLSEGGRSRIFSVFAVSDFGRGCALENGRWKTGVGKRALENARWKMRVGKCALENCTKGP
jgi:hypothetical protein